MLKNAFEAAAETANPCIRISAKANDASRILFVSVENPYAGNLSHLDNTSHLGNIGSLDELSSTKGGDHQGLGLKNLAAAARRNDITYRIHTEARADVNYFCIDLTLQYT